MKNEYLDLIFTNHAIERMTNRGLRQDLAWETWKHPDEILEGKNPDSYEYIKYKDDYKITVIAKQNERNEWLIISAWVDPPLPGSMDANGKSFYKRYQKASFWGKLWLTLRSQLGL